MKYYLTVARVNNITDASAELQVSPSTVARRISELEKELGATLFNKRSNGYFQSESSLEIFPLAEEVEAKIGTIERRLESSEGGRAHIVKIDVPELLGHEVLIPGLKLLQRTEPNISFEFTNSARNSKLSARANDIVVRYGRPDSGSYKLKKIGMVSRALYCSAEYVDEHGMPELPAHLSKHFLIGWDKEFAYLPVAKWFMTVTENNKRWMTASNLKSQLDAVVSGLGIAALPKFVAEKYKLLQVFPEISPLNSEVYILKNTETTGLESVNIVATHIEEIIRSQRSSFVVESC